MDRTLGLLSRAAAALILAGTIPACSSTKVNPPLFIETFSTYPSGAWTGPTLTGTATAAPETTAGPRQGSLKITAAGAATAATTTTTSFNSAPLTISLQMAATSGGASEAGTGTVTILNATPAAVATASWDNTTGLITFHINGGSADATALVSGNGTFHLLVFKVASDNTATWTVDGVLAVTQSAFVPAMLKVQLGGTFTTGGGVAWPAFFFDNISITSP